ncbi:MAG TPA: hypothetical protein VF275_00565 [Gammaproteobacteria bacterium]
MSRFSWKFLCALTISTVFAAPVSAAACSNPMFEAFRQLAGNWQVFRDGELAGKLAMRSVAGGCAMLEEWQTIEGVKAVALHWPETVTEGSMTVDGETLEMPASDVTPETVLQQVYVDSNGWSIRADGSISEGVLVYEGNIMEDGQELVLRATLRGLGSDEIVHVGEVSTDAGETWQDSFTLIYKRAAD